MPDLSVQQTFDLAWQHHEAGRLTLAEELYRRVLAQTPNDPEVIHQLGLIAFQLGNNSQALELFRECIGLDPQWADAHNNLGNILASGGDLTGAIAAYKTAAALDASAPAVYQNLAEALRRDGQIEAAIEACRQAIALDPHSAPAHNRLGLFLKNQRKLDEAIAAFRQAIVIQPNYLEAHGNLGDTLLDNGDLHAAIDAFGTILSMRPDSAETHCNLGAAFFANGQLDEAIDAYRAAIRVRPDLFAAYNNLGNALKDAGQIDESIAAFREALRLAPDSTLAHSNLCYSLYFHPGFDGRQIAQEHRLWNERHAQPLRPKSSAPHANNPDPNRRLRIGYVSPDFCMHVVGQNLLPLIRHHDHQHFEITCYANVAKPDAMTELFQQFADRWHDIAAMNDEQVAEQIRRDGIDVLVDLALHTVGNRLLVFARKPAPVQVTYLAYCGTSGMSAMDYRLSDPFFDPPFNPADTDLSWDAERTIRLPHTYWCYQPCPAPLPSPPPALKNGFITFGCQNNFAKVSASALALWQEILAAIPHSRLIIHSRSARQQVNVLQNFEHAGVASDRIRFVGKQSFEEYMQTYAKIDIALDPFPFGGGITSLDALWMGVPLVTLSGETPVGRGGRSILSNLGLPALIAHSPRQYKQIAIDLAQDHQRLAELRMGMRDRMLASPLLDAPAFARDVEAAYREMWRDWCKSAHLPTQA